MQELKVISILMGSYFTTHLFKEYVIKKVKSNPYHNRERDIEMICYVFFAVMLIVFLVIFKELNLLTDDVI